MKAMGNVGACWGMGQWSDCAKKTNETDAKNTQLFFFFSAEKKNLVEAETAEKKKKEKKKIHTKARKTRKKI
jgi:hypothetical protein